MCTANFQNMMGKLGKLDVTSRTKDFNGGRSPALQKEGFAGTLPTPGSTSTGSQLATHSVPGQVSGLAARRASGL